MSGKRISIAIIAAVLLGFPAGWIVAMTLTPVLCRLEPLLHMELAGHSGPSDWFFMGMWALLIPALFLLFRQIFLQSARKE